MTFSEYLISKKIDEELFKKGNPDLFRSWEEAFEQMHPKSFTAQMLYLINPVRLKYTLRSDQAATQKKFQDSDKPSASKPKPVFKIKPKFK